MLTTIYHPIHAPEVVEGDEAERLLASGFWFDSPLKAKQYREKLEDEIKNEPKVVLMTKAKKGSKANEKSC